MPRLDINPPVDFTRLFARRFLLSATVVFGTYNPSGYSYYHWLIKGDGVTTPKFFVGVLLFTCVVAIARMAFLALGYFGLMALSLMIIMSIIGGVGLGFLSFAEVHITTYFLLFWISIVLGVGTGWAFLQKRIAGERDVLRTPP